MTSVIFALNFSSLAAQVFVGVPFVRLQGSRRFPSLIPPSHPIAGALVAALCSAHQCWHCCLHPSSSPAQPSPPMPCPLCVNPVLFRGKGKNNFCLKIDDIGGNYHRISDCGISLCKAVSSRCTHSSPPFPPVPPAAEG